VLARDVTYPNARARASSLRAALGAGEPARPAAGGATLAGVEGQAITAARYRLLAEIGRGATGAVYRARDAELERDVAVKLLHAHLGGHGTLARFFAEARVAAALRHPNIVAVLDLDEEHRRIVMELLAGGTLRERLRDGRLPIAEALERHAEILAALAAAHRRGVIHRDLKPANLLFRRAAPPTELVLGDFGTAHLGAPMQVDVLVGTLRYMAPEQRRGKAGPSGDVYAAGVILHEMLGGQAPASLAAAAPDAGLELPAAGRPPWPSTCAP
jgi:serine/threonine-protein kinase